jgi:hypothetical protein
MRRPSAFVTVISVAVAIATGLVVLVQQFFSNPYLDPIGNFLVASATYLVGFALLLALLNLLSVHFQRVAQRSANAWSSAVILITATGVFVTVLPSGGASAASAWIFRFVYQPLEASFLALLVFFSASAAYRALRVRSWENALLVISALVVLIGAAPISRAVTSFLPEAKEWLLNVPTVAGVRGILLGVALGVIATGLRLLTGIDRPYSE